MNSTVSPDVTEELLAHSVDVISVLDSDGVIRYESPSTRRVLGYDPAAVVGDDAFEHVHPDDREAAIAAFERVVESDSEYETEALDLRVRHADGSWVWVESRTANRTAGADDGYVVTTRDISERKERERQLERTNDRLEEFARIVSHDLRNPLNVAQGHLELARAEDDSEHLEAVARTHDRMAELIEDLLTLARTGDGIGEQEPVALATIAEACWATVGTADATLRVDTDATISADASRLRQLLENLVRNGVEHGGADVTLSVGDLPDGFYVADDGPGIPEAEREDVFDGGYSTARDGTGCGLRIAEEIADAHGWAIAVVESETGGARFEITGVDRIDG